MYVYVALSTLHFKSINTFNLIHNIIKQDWKKKSSILPCGFGAPRSLQTNGSFFLQFVTVQWLSVTSFSVDTHWLFPSNSAGCKFFHSPSAKGMISSIDVLYWVQEMLFAEVVFDKPEKRQKYMYLKCFVKIYAHVKRTICLSSPNASSIHQILIYLEVL